MKSKPWRVGNLIIIWPACFLFYLDGFPSSWGLNKNNFNISYRIKFDFFRVFKKGNNYPRLESST